MNLSEYIDVSMVEVLNGLIKQQRGKVRVVELIHFGIWAM